MVEHFCADTGIADLVDGVSGLRPGHRKLDQLQATVSATGLRPDQMLFVGDSVHDIDLANQTGTRFAGVTGLFAAEGVRPRRRSHDRRSVRAGRSRGSSAGPPSFARTNGP